MGIAERHYYRFTYLKSEHWQNLRLEKLASRDAKCQMCGRRDLSNDVHHMRYRGLFDAKLSDLLVMCRRCHNRVHKVIEILPELKIPEGTEAKWLWKFRKKWFNEVLVNQRNQIMLGISQEQVVKQMKKRFFRVRCDLLQKRLICSNLQMPFRRELLPRMLRWYNRRWPKARDIDWVTAWTTFDWPSGEH